MPGLLSASVLLLAAAFASPGQAVERHRFELVSAVPALDAGGSPVLDTSERCLAGRYQPGLRVHLLSDGKSSACAVETGRVGETENGGECTVLVGAERCTGTFTLGVLGAKGAYKRVDARPVQGRAREELGRAIGKEAARAATLRWSSVLAGLPYREGIDDALSWRSLGGGATLARLKFEHPYVRGPWVVISQGKADAIVGPFSMQAPWAFTLDGQSYVVFTIAGCLDCGAVGTEVHAVRVGKFHRVLESFANAD